MCLTLWEEMQASVHSKYLLKDPNTLRGERHDLIWSQRFLSPPPIRWSSQLETSAGKLGISVHTGNSLSVRMPAGTGISAPTPSLPERAWHGFHLSSFFFLTEVLLLFMAAYTKLSGPHISSNSPVSASHLLWSTEWLQSRALPHSAFCLGSWIQNSGHQASCYQCFSHWTVFPASETNSCSVVQSDLKLPV